MKTIFSIYKQIQVKEVSYESGDQTVTAKCLIQNGQDTMETEMQFSHSDLNRMISKIMAMGYDFKIEQVNHLDFGDGTEVIDYAFENVFGEAVTLEEFEFNHEVRKIRA